jgi:thiol-disulfide isomerase/thioredoxin
VPPLLRAASAMLAGSAVLAAAACSGGALGESTPLSNGQSFVSGSYGTTYYRPGARPAAPAVSGTTLDGRRFSLAGDRGSVVVLNFWGSWCAPCRQEAPTLAALARHFADRRGARTPHVHFVGVDMRDTPAAAHAFMRTFSVGYPSVNDPGSLIALAFRGTLPPAGIPSTLVIDRTGHLAARVVGQVSYRGLGALISRIAGAPA